MPERGCDMSTTTQERLETAVKNLEQYGEDLDAKGELPSGEDLAELKNRMKEVKDLKAAFENEAEARGTAADAKAFLAQLSGGGAEKEQTPSLTVSGLPMQTNGKTFGEMFVESGGYQDFLGRYAKGGIIPNGTKGVQSHPFQIDSKALVTGVSSTSAGAFVVNDRYGRSAQQTPTPWSTFG
jgi:hypothetical protein